MMLPWSGGLALAGVMAVAAAGYWAGDHNRNNAWLARQATQERALRQAVQAQSVRSQAAQQQAADAAAALQISYSTLEGQFNALKSHGPLVVFRDAGPALGAGSGTGVAGATDAAADGLVAAMGDWHPQRGHGAAGGADADAGVGLSFGAVWMWNSALLGVDTAAGACSAADTASAACAADSGVGLEAAWANHATNAQSCATDRLRQQQLIDFLTARAGAP